MALSWYTYPNITLRQSMSYPFVIIVTASAYGTANVTQHRVRARILYGTTQIVDKYSIVYDETNKLVKFDLSEIWRNQLPIVQTDVTAGADITKITGLQALEEPSQKHLIVEFTEQYYLSGVFTSSATITRTYACLRGYTSPITANNEWRFGNWWQVNGLENFMPFSGKIFQVYPMRAEDTAWSPAATDPYLHIRLYRNGSGLSASYSAARTDKGILYFPIYLAGVSDTDTFTHWRVLVGVGPTAGTVSAFYDDFLLYKNIDDCEGENETIMFQDRLNTWAFMHFPMKSRTTVTTQGIAGELIPTADKPGRFKYNVEASDVLALNTGWMQEEQNPLVQDLISTESAWLVDPSDGSLEQVVVIPSSVTLKKRSTDRMIQYGISFRKSVNNFKP
jgi:hypothetical protein